MDGVPLAHALGPSGRGRGPRRRFGCAAVALGAGLALLLGGCSREPATPPNLLLITVDTLRADRLACYGGEPDVGTAICSLADRGTRFRWAFSTAPHTVPSVASILTSRYPAYHGVSQGARSYLADEATTLAEVLAAAGYTTAAFVSNPVLEKYRNLGQGFAVYDTGMTRRERNRPNYGEREAQSTTDSALAWAQIHSRPPWFMWVHFQDPHGPYDPPGAAPERDAPGEFRLRVLRGHSGRRGIPSYQVLPGLFTAGAYQRRYLDEIRYLDSHVDRLVKGLDALGDPPAVLLTADHGEAFGEDDHYFAHGHSVGLDQVLVPLLWRPPRAGRAAVEEAPVSILDAAPTLLSVAGLDVPDTFQGRSLPAAGVDAKRGDENRPIFCEHARQAAVIAGHTYYARDRGPRDPGWRAASSRYPALPRRTAQLSGEDPLPAYHPAVGEGPESVLEALLAEHLDAARNRVQPLRDEVPDEILEPLRALGYLE